MECKHDPAKLPGFGRLAGSCLHATFCLAQHYSAWWLESAWLTSFCNFRNPGNNSLSGAEFCSLRAPLFMRLWQAKRRQTAYTPNPPNTYAGHKLQQKNASTQVTVNAFDKLSFKLKVVPSITTLPSKQPRYKSELWLTTLV